MTDAVPRPGPPAAWSDAGLELPDPEATAQAAAAFATGLAPGDLILLHGPLGAGKTAWVRGACVALGVAPEEVTSPTYTLMHYYAGRWPVLHADLYRLDGPAPAHAVGLDEELDAGEAVVFVEWPERLQETPATRTFEVRLEITAGDRRVVRLRQPDRERG